jgi:hypothetical protein
LYEAPRNQIPIAFDGSVLKIDKKHFEIKQSFGNRRPYISSFNKVYKFAEKSFRKWERNSQQGSQF